MEFLGPEAWKHKDDFDEVKRRVGITHDHFDCWIYRFFENKHFDVEETVAKLIRRADMERNEFATYEMTPVIRGSMTSGVIQIIGEDKKGRMLFYIVTCRDFPTKEIREARKRNFDMWLSYGCRLRRNNPKCQIAMLINQRGASMWSNTDMTFQTNIAIRISKYYPGAVDKAWVCCMSGALGAIARPVLRAMPKALSEKIYIYNEADVAGGVLLPDIEESMIPTSLGGTNDVDDPSRYEKFADDVTLFFEKAKAAIQAGRSMKEFEYDEIQAEIQAEDVVKKKEEQERWERRSFAAAAAAERYEPDFADDTEGPPSRRNRPRPPLVVSSPRHWDPHVGSSAAASGGDGDDLVTCGTPTEHSLLAEDEELAYMANSADARYAVGLTYYSTGMLEDRETFFRDSFEQMQRLTYQSMSTVFVTSINNAKDMAASRDETQFLAMRCPMAARSLVRGVLTVLCVLIAAYFFAASLFVQLFGASIIVVLFVAMYNEPYYVYPLGLALLLVGHQSALLGSRGFELAHATLRGALLRPLQPLGAHGLVVQFIGFLVLVLIQFSAFLATSSFDDPLMALAVAFAIGWLACLALIVIFHLGFPLGLAQEPSPSRTATGHGGLSLYLFIDVTEDEESEEPYRSRRRLTSNTVTTTVPALAAAVFGLAFMISADLVFIIGATICTFGACFAVNHFVRAATLTDVNSHLARSAAWFCGVAWIYIVVAIGLLGWVSPWYESILISGGSVLAFLLLTVACHVVRKGSGVHRILFRLSYVLLILIILVGIVLLFVQHWALGLFALVMLVHSMGSFARPASMTFAGSLIVTVVSLIIFIYSLTLAFNSAPEYAQSEVIPANITTPEDASTIPVCGRRWQGGTELNVADFALVVRSSYASTANLTNSDIQLLTNKTIVHERRVNVTQQAYVDVFRASNATLYSVHVLPHRITLLRVVIFWIEAIALTPHALVLPMNWTAGFVSAAAFVNDFFPLHEQLVVDTQRVIAALHQNATTAAFANGQQPSTAVFITGHGLAGGMASIIGSRMGIETVTFSSPGLLFSRGKFSVDYYRYLRFVTSIVPSTGILVTIDSHGPRKLDLPCFAGPLMCQSVDFVVCAVVAACGGPTPTTLKACVQAKSLA